MEKTKVAIIGGGWFGNFHLDNLMTMPEVEVVAFASTNSERLERLQRKAPLAHAYSNHEAMISQEEKIDALIVCVPPDSHNDVEAMAASNHIHLYLEKPLGVSLEQIKKNEQIINDSKIICSIGYQTRYNPVIDKMKTFLIDKKVGSVVAKWFGVMPSTPWWRVKARSGGQLAEQVTHMLDVLRYLFGDIKSVYSASRKGLITSVPDYDVEDSSSSVFIFESGLLVTVNCGCFVEGASCESEICFEIFAENAKAEYFWDKEASWGDKKKTETYRFGNDFHKPAIQTFITAIRTDDPSMIRSSYSDAVKTFTATYGANLSMESHTEIILADI